MSFGAESGRRASEKSRVEGLRVRSVVAFAALTFAFGACSDEEAGDSLGGGPPVTGSGGSTFIPEPSTGGSTSAQGGSAGKGSGPLACSGIPLDSGGGEGGDSSVCESVSNEAKSVPVDLDIMMDRSISRNEEAGGGQTRWEAIRDAVYGVRR